MASRRQVKIFDFEELSETATVDTNVDIESKLEKKKERPLKSRKLSRLRRIRLPPRSRAI